MLLHVSDCRRVDYTAKSLTDNDRGYLRDFADVIVGLHNTLDACDGEVVFDNDAVDVRREHGAPTRPIAYLRHLHLQLGRERRVWDVVCILHLYLRGRGERRVRIWWHGLVLGRRT